MGNQRYRLTFVAVGQRVTIADSASIPQQEALLER